MPSYYDYLLAAIPTVMVAAPAALSVVELPYTTGIVVGAAIALGLVGHGMFVKTPTDPAHAQSASTTQPRDVTHSDSPPGQDTQLDSPA